ncbi:MAG TPA: putative toxin-antitoxin system toxin component, PIN family [Nitrososphaerales archaeon]|nr:putative toxin-antitoxin system toxin component, PIN family [Nitrososphaerales archaeon]
MRVVVDTNVLISALIRGGKPRRVLFHLFEQHQVVSSPQLLAELADVLSRGKFDDVDESQIETFLSILSSGVILVTPSKSFKVISEDPDDDVVLSTAYQGGATHIVSGDRHLLDLGEFKGIRIVTVKKMFELLLESRHDE